MKASRIYREAARRIAQKDGYSCCVVDEVAGGSINSDGFTPVTWRYIATFAECPIAFWIRYDANCVRDDAATAREVQNWRVLALLFMACIAEDEEAGT